MYTRSVIRGFIWSLYIWWKHCEEKSHLQKKTLQSCSDCCSDDAHRVSGNLCCSWGQPWALLSSSSHMGSLLRELMAIFLLTSLLGSLFLPSSHQGDREIQEFLCRESPVWMWGGGCRPPGGGCLSFAFLDQIFLREDLLVWLRALLFVLGGLLWIFFASPFCALGLYKILLIRYHSAFSAFI